VCLEGRCIDPRVVWFIYIHSPASQKRSDLWDSGVMHGTKRLLLAIGALTLLERAGFMNCACQCLRPGPSQAAACYVLRAQTPRRLEPGTGERRSPRFRANRGWGRGSGSVSVPGQIGERPRDGPGLYCSRRPSHSGARAEQPHLVRSLGS
jgi:hypothetical protein